VTARLGEERRSYAALENDDANVWSAECRQRLMLAKPSTSL
jgi:hypothetical protein